MIKQHLYQIQIPSDNVELLHATVSSLASFIQDRVRKQQIHHEQWRVVLSDLLIRSALSNELGLPQKTIQYEYSSYGKPFLCNGRRHFNLSHSNKMIVLITDATPVGIDIEYLKPLNDLDDLIQVFSSEERAALNKMRQEDRQEIFYRLWVAKESYLKALGIGLSWSLDSFVIEDFRDDIGVVRGEVTWYIKAFKIADHYQGAICAQHTHFANQIILRNFEDLIAETRERDC